MRQPVLPLSLPKTLAYASLSIPLAAVGLPVQVFITPMYANELGLGIGLTGTIFMLLRFWDIFTDVGMGVVIDRYPSKWGRVRHWLALGVPILCLAAFFLYMPPRSGVGATYLAVWLVVFYTGFTLISTAHQAWVPAISVDYDDRTRLFKWREYFNIGALIVLLVVPSLISRVIGLDIFGVVAIMGVALMISMPATAYIAIRHVPDPNIVETSAKTSITFADIKEALRSGPLWRIFTIETCVGIAVSAVAVNYRFLANFSFGVQEGSEPVLILFFIAGFLMLPLWMRLSDRTEKHIALRTVLGLSIPVYLFWFVVARFDGIAALAIGATISGLTFGAPFALVRSMLADVIDEKRMSSGQDRAGLYYSLMTGAIKLGSGLAVGISYNLAQALIGFNPSGTNSASQILGFEIIFVSVPVVAFLVAMLVAWNFPITRKVHADIRKQLDAQSNTAVP